MMGKGGKGMDFFNKLGDTISGIGKDVSQNVADLKIGRASCRERVCLYV